MRDQKLGPIWQYECPESETKIHHWLRREDRTAVCKKCKAVMMVAEAADCFGEMTRT